MTKKIAKHSVLKALGALCVDKDFRDAYFKKRSVDVVRNKTKPKIDITDAEYTDFSAMVPTPTLGPQAVDFEPMFIRVCPEYPCRLAALDSELVLGTALVDDAFRAALFTDFDQALQSQGLSLQKEQHDLMQERLQVHGTRDTMDSVAKKIKEATVPTLFVLETAA